MPIKLYIYIAYVYIIYICICVYAYTLCDLHGWHMQSSVTRHTSAVCSVVPTRWTYELISARAGG